MNIYFEIKDRNPVLKECFFAYSEQQFKEGVAKAGIEGKKIFQGIAGLYGTKEGIKELMDYYTNQSKEIGEKCDPQFVYDFEYNNHECGYTNCDQEPWLIVKSYFTKKQCDSIKRKSKWWEENSNG
jgi:hypothetical protein